MKCSGQGIGVEEKENHTQGRGRQTGRQRSRPGESDGLSIVTVKKNSKGINYNMTKTLRLLFLSTVKLFRVSHIKGTVAEERNEKETNKRSI